MGELGMEMELKEIWACMTYWYSGRQKTSSVTPGKTNGTNKCQPGIKASSAYRLAPNQKYCEKLDVHVQAFTYFYLHTPFTHFAKCTGVGTSPRSAKISK